MRTIDIHKVTQPDGSNAVNGELTITVLDAPGAGGAHHAYRITGFNPQTVVAVPNLDAGYLEVIFQKGPIKEVGVNGVTNEALLALVIDRLSCFQAGPFACAENAKALGEATACLETLKSRTRERLSRGVEGQTKL